jgi:uncharacterized protein (TIGR02246 family)
VPDDDALRSVYQYLLAAWNHRSGKDFAAQFAEYGEIIGFDGSETRGRASIESEMKRIFADHATGEYVGKVREVSRLMPQVAVVRAVAGVVPAGESDLNPALNSVQTLVLQKMGGRWWIVLYQNTPAQFHGRPEMVESLTEELREARTSGNK